MKGKGKCKNDLNEPALPYTISGSNSIKKALRIMSFEQQEEETRNYSASLTPGQRLQWLHEIRKERLKQFLINDGTFPPIQKTISIRQI